MQQLACRVIEKKKAPDHPLITAPSENPLKDKWYRMNNLYVIVNESGKSVKFKLRPTQQNLFEHMWFQNNILKSRQHGITTFIGIYILDECVFNSDREGGIIAHRQEDASKIFRRKIKYPYDHLPQWIQDERKLTTDSKSEMIFANNSSIYVSTSMRSGTVQYLHISEFGYTCAKAPHKAEEIVTGAMEAIHEGSILFIESTARSRAGTHYEWCKTDQDKKRSNTPLTRMDRKFFFFPWWEDPKNALIDSVPINQRNADYFKNLWVKYGIKLSGPQKHWWVKKREDLGEKIKQEHPSTPEEAFEASIEGAYFANQMMKLRERGGICSVPIIDGVDVQTSWDLGRNDFMAIWLFQVVGREMHFVGYYENSGEAFPHYKQKLDQIAEERKFFKYGKHWAPHDISVHELFTPGSRWEAAKDIGLHFEYVERPPNKMDAIETARKFLSICAFDEVYCEIGITRLDNFQKRWNDHLGCYADEPKKDDNRHGADAFQTVAIVSTKDLYYIPRTPVVKPANYVYT